MQNCTEDEAHCTPETFRLHGAFAPAMKTASDPSLGFLLVWQLATLVLVLLLPAALLGEWPWALPGKERLPYAALLAAFGASAVFQLLIRGQAPKFRLLLAVLGPAAIFSLALAFLFVMRANSSRMLMLAILFSAVVILTVPFIGRWLRILGAMMLGVTMAGTAALSAKKHLDIGGAVDARSSATEVATSLYNLRVIAHHGQIPRPAVRGGGFSRLGDRVLLATGDGHLYSVAAPGGTLDVRAMPYRIPINGEAFARAAGREYKEPEKSRDFGAQSPPGVHTWRFRVAGVLAQERKDGTRIFAAHHYWHAALQCFTIRLSVLEIPHGAPSADPPGRWRTMFDASPCLPLRGPDAKQGKHPFYGEESGGRLALLDDDTLLLTVGDMGFSGVESRRMLAQDPEAAYGKTIRFDLRSGEHRIFTTGHRNPQGLYVGDDAIWLTEHGPRGGDELNVLIEGQNYGWPLVTYGTDYGAFTWPLNARPGRHDGYPEAVYAWVPSAGITNLIRHSGGARFAAWRGDFLVGALSTRSMYRLRVRDGRVVFSEAIELGARVRDLIELADGRILAWTDEAALLEIAPAEGMSGALLFGNRCASCHAIRDGLAHRAGPDLFGIVGRGVAEAEMFEYSAAIRAAGGRWTIERLDAFLTDPQAVMPGTSMASAGVTDARERALIIEHLAAAGGVPR